MHMFVMPFETHFEIGCDPEAGTSRGIQLIFWSQSHGYADQQSDWRHAGPCMLI